VVGFGFIPKRFLRNGILLSISKRRKQTAAVITTMSTDKTKKKSQEAKGIPVRSLSIKRENLGFNHQYF